MFKYSTPECNGVRACVIGRVARRTQVPEAPAESEARWRRSRKNLTNTRQPTGDPGPLRVVFMWQFDFNSSPYYKTAEVSSRSLLRTPSPLAYVLVITIS